MKQLFLERVHARLMSSFMIPDTPILEPPKDDGPFRDRRGRMDGENSSIKAAIEREICNWIDRYEDYYGATTLDYA